MSDASKSNRNLVIFGLVSGLVLLLAVGLAVSWMSRSAVGGRGVQPTFTVSKGPLTISVTESGTITAKDQVVVKSEVQGKPTIIFLIDEGVHVNEGDLLVELDSSALRTELVEQDIKVQNAEAAHVQAQETLAATRLQAQADLAAAEQAHLFARQDLAKYLDGEYPMELKKASTEIELKKEALDTAIQTLEWSQKLYDEEYLSGDELEKDRTAANRAKLEHEVAVQAHELLEQYTRPRQIATLEGNVEQTRLALEKSRRSTAADVVKAEADERAKRADFENQKAKHAKLLDQIAKCKMIAPTSGMVVYATTGKGGWRPEEPLREGQEVRERQELIYLPTASTKTAEIKIHESVLDKVAAGMPVRITVDALPGKRYAGRVSRISPLPDAQSVWMNPDLKVYNTQIDLEGAVDDIRTGMTCRAEILIDYYEDATFLPVQAVVRVGRQPTVWVRRGEEFEARPVELGLSNNAMVRVTGGVEPGDVISLTPPLAAAGREEDGEAVEFSRGDVEGARAAQATPRPTPDAAAAPAAGAPAAPGAAAPSAEQREKWRQAAENMTPEQRAAARDQWQKSQGQTQ